MKGIGMEVVKNLTDKHQKLRDMYNSCVQACVNECNAIAK
jgi:hypothetical protein